MSKSNRLLATKEDENILMKITDVINDCLEPIFGYLKMEDLFSVALADVNFIDVAALVFKRKYGRMTIKVHPHEIYAYKGENRLYERFKIDWVKPFNEFAFLRIFGQSISKLHIVSYVGAKMMNAIKSYISEYCARGLVTTEFVMPSRWTTFVRTFRWKYLDEDSFTSSSNRLPPKLESLSVRCSDQYFMGRANFVLEHLKHLSLTQYEWSVLDPPPAIFPNLEFLEVQTMFRLTEPWFHFIASNKNLIKLGLFSQERKYFDNDSLLDLVDGLPKLKVLAINELNIDLESIPGFLSSCNTLKHLRLYEGWWDDDKSFKEMLSEKTIAGIEDEWEIHGDYRCAAFIRKT